MFLTNEKKLPLGENRFLLDFLKFCVLEKRPSTHPDVIILSIYRVKVKKNLLPRHKYTPLHGLFYRFWRESRAKS